MCTDRNDDYVYARVYDANKKAGRLPFLLLNDNNLEQKNAKNFHGMEIESKTISGGPRPNYLRPYTYNIIYDPYT